MPAVEAADASEVIRERLMHLEALRDALSVFVYVSTRREVDTRKLIGHLLHTGKHVCVPRLDEVGHMHAHLIHNLDDLIPDAPGQFSIPVPPANAPIEHHPDVALVPGLAFTHTGHRLGFGAGHYDRYLADHPDTLTVGLCYDWQLIDTFPAEPHDHPMDWLVTDQRVIPCVD